MAIGIDWDGGRQMLATAAELGSREGHPAWKSFVIGQKQRSLRWVHFLVTDQHEGQKNRRRRPYPPRCGGAVIFTSCATAQTLRKGRSHPTTHERGIRFDSVPGNDTRRKPVQKQSLIRLILSLSHPDTDRRPVRRHN